MSNNRVTNVSQKIKGTSSFVKILIVIFAVIFVIGLIVWIIFIIKNKVIYVRNNPVILSGEISADTTSQENNAYVIPNLPTSINGNLYSYSMWIYINDYVRGYGDYKNIISRSNKDENIDTKIPSIQNDAVIEAPGIYLDKKMNKLIAYTSVINSSANVCEVNNIPLNKWNHIVYVLNQNNVDLYLNGKLEKSCVINGIANTNTAYKLYIGKDTGFNGKFAQIQYFTEAIEPSKVTELYNKGPSGTNKFVLDDKNNKFSNINYSKLKNDICSGDTNDIGQILKNL